MFPGVWLENTQIQIHKYKYTNTNTQIHKYANTALVKAADRHDMYYIFEKVMVQETQKQGSWVYEESFSLHEIVQMLVFFNGFLY